MYFKLSDECNGLFCEIGNDIFELIILQYGDFSWNKCNIFSIRFRLLHNFQLVSHSGLVSFLPSELTGNLHGPEALHHHLVTSITGLLTERDGQPKG